MTTHDTGLSSLFLAALIAVGCGVDTADHSASGGGQLQPPACSPRGPRMTRRLSNLQLHNTLAAAFQDPNVPTGDVLNDPVILGFKGDATQSVVRDLDAQLIMNNAEAVADWAVGQKLGQLSSCQSMDPACAQQLIQTLGKKLYREPVPASSVDAYVELFAQEASFAEGARAVISAMLQSSYVLYRRELGVRGEDGLYHLTPYELASSLSYLLTNGPPDDQLMAAADQGQLANTADLDREAARLLATPAAEAAFGAFARSWLVVDDLATRAKLDPTNQLTDAVRTAMLGETQAMFMNVLRSDATVSELFTASYTFVDQTLAGYYQIGGAGGGFQRVELPPGTRAHGILGEGAILTRHALADRSSPVQRGKLVRERLLCEELMPPPPNVDTNLPPPTGAVTTRQRYEAHEANPFCNSCHRRIDPIGFAFEHFDGFGKRRDQENGVAIDSTGVLSGMPAGDVALDGLDSLSSYLATSPEVTQCLTRYIAYNAYGLDHCSEDAIQGELAAGTGSVKSIVMAVIHAPQFTTRTE
ncbi:MAG TPA: DUF1592 domain-containing protein [Kofleriaceae bacterium]|nr:DUF1592 domain-containing protein [Kofleriaceae bacterium]